MQTRRNARVIGAGLGISLAITAAACEGGGIDKAGGTQRAAPVVLTFATNQPFLPVQLETYPQEVERLSGGAIRIDIEVGWRAGEPQQEVGLIGDVRAGKVDMGWVGARAFDAAGVTSFQALVAPLLVDSYDLEREVFDAGIPTRMLQAVGTIGLAGIGVVPGPMRKMTGISHPFASPSDFAHQIVGIQGGILADETFRVLGATPRLVPAGGNVDGLDALDYQLEQIPQRPDATVVANLNLWPRPLAVVANADRFKGLTTEQQEILRTAATNLIDPAVDVTRGADAHAGAGLCMAGTNVVAATMSDLAALREAVQPVYAELEHDADTNAFLDEIRSLKSRLAAPPESFRCPREPGSSAEVAATPFDGVYQATTSADDLRNAGDPNPLPENYGAFTLVFDRRRFAITQQSGEACTWAYGTYVVNGDRVEWTYLDGGGISPNHAYNKPGEFFTFGWSLYREALTLTAVPGDVSPAVFLVRPWHRLDAAPSASLLNPDCPPPPGALRS